MTSEIDESGSIHPLVRALRRILRPLVRLLIEKQLLFPFVADLLKSIYVEVAETDFPLEGKRQTVSRLSLLTGIHRREVKRIQADFERDDGAMPSSIALGAQVVARWTGEAPWIDESGQPRPLPKKSADPEAASFERLVSSVSVDIHPRSLLDEWQRLGLASIDDDGRVHLETAAFVPVHGFDEKAHFAGRNLRDHIAAAAHNLTTEERPFLERSVYYGSLPPAAIAELRKLAFEAGQTALQSVHRRAQELKNEASALDEGPQHRHRITFGVYLFDAPNRADAGTDESPESHPAETERRPE